MSIVNRVKEDPQKWLNEVRRTADQNGVRLKIEVIVNPASIVGAIENHNIAKIFASDLCQLSCVSCKMTILFGTTWWGLRTFRYTFPCYLICQPQVVI